MADETFSDDDLELLPADDEELLDADDQLAAAEASLTDDVFDAGGAAPPPVPFGRTWAFDFNTERYVRAGASPLEVRGKDALRQWIYAALHTAQGVHPIFSDEFGIEDPEDWLGVTDPTEALATFEPRAREASTQHDRVEEVDDVDIAFDPSTGVITVTKFDVITDEAEAVQLGVIDISPTF